MSSPYTRELKIM